MDIDPPEMIDLNDRDDPEADLPTLEETSEEWAERGDEDLI
jgi:hypothetical protein